MNRAQFWTYLSLLLLMALLGGDALHAAEEGKPLRVIFVMDGRIKGEEIDDDDQHLARDHLEARLTRQLKELFALKSFDDEVLKSVKADAETWAVMTGGTADDVRQVLEEHKLDAFIRVTYRTAPVAKLGQKYFGAASLTAELVNLSTAEKAAFIESPPMGTPDAEGVVKHPVMMALDPYDAGLQALDYAAKQLVARLGDSEAVTRLKAGKPLSDEAINTGNAPAGRRVIFLVKGKVKGKNLDASDKAMAYRQLEAILDRKLKTALGIRNFDKSTLDTVKNEAEQWAVLTGGSAAEVREILKAHELDAFVRVSFRTAPVFGVTDEATGITMYSGSAMVTATVVDLKTAEKAILVESPPMGTNDHPARRGLDPFDAGMSALEYATDRMIERLKSQVDGSPLDPTEGKGEAPAAVQPAKGPTLPTVAVLVVKPEFGYWVIPRMRNNAVRGKMIRKMKSFVDTVKKTGTIGTRVGDYLGHGIQSTGTYSLLEASESTQAGVGTIRDKILEYRMAGWVQGRVPAPPADFSQSVGADYYLTARIIKLWESTASISGPFVSKGNMTGHAEVEVTLTDARTGQSRSARGTGKFSQSGWGTIMEFNPGAVALDKLMVGVAVKQALLDAAEKLGVAAPGVATAVGQNPNAPIPVATPAVTTTAAGPVAVAVMPLAVSLVANDQAKEQEERAGDPVFRRSLWARFGDAVRRSSHYEIAPLPDGAEADEIIRSQILHATGLMSVDEFRKVKSFTLPERFLYGVVNVEIHVRETMRSTTISYSADCILKLVEGQTFSARTILGSGGGSSMDAAIDAAIKSALSRPAM